jgi:hypothetical protein
VSGQQVPAEVPALQLDTARLHACQADDQYNNKAIGNSNGRLGYPAWLQIAVAEPTQSCCTCCNIIPHALDLPISTAAAAAAAAAAADKYICCCAALLLPVTGGATFFYPAGTTISSSSLLAPFYTSGWGGYW